MVAAQREAAIENLPTILAEIETDIDVASEVDQKKVESTTEDDFDPEEPLDSDEEMAVPHKCVPRQLL